MIIPVIFEDDYLLLIDKPSGLTVNKSETTRGDTIQDWAVQNIDLSDSKNISRDSDFYKRVGIVHRLDKETSGLLLIAKNPGVFADLQEQFQKRKVKKTYYALVHGEIKPDEGQIRVPIARLPWNRFRFGVMPMGRQSVTRYRLIKSFMLGNQQISLVSLFPQTGRTHQIRVHMSYIGHPVVGDSLYSGRKKSISDRKNVGRLMLHAAKIEFTHPVTLNFVAFTAPIPDDMKRIIGYDY